MHTVRPPARDRSTQLLGAQMRQCPWGWPEPTLCPMGDGATFLCIGSSSSHPGPPRAAYLVPATTDRCEAHLGGEGEEKGPVVYPHQ